jgi:stage II sporulation protein D
MKRTLALLFAVALAGQLLSLAQRPAPAANLRVGVWTLWHDRSITISSVANSPSSLRTCQTCASVPLLKPVEVRATQGIVSIKGLRETAEVSTSGAVTLTAHGETLTLHEPLRIAAQGGELTLAVTLPVEAYVERVVASESGPADSPESLKALAIVVRSFALHDKHGHAAYDLCDSTHCQLIRWVNAPEWRRSAHAATLATAGETLWFNGRPAAAWFSQNCGGRTAAPDEVWMGAEKPGPMPWLVSQADPYCTAHGAREWSASLSLDELTRALAGEGLVRPGWQTLTIERRGQSGRAVMLRVGATEIRAEDFRLAVGRAFGWGRILSNWYEVSRQDPSQGRSVQGPVFVFHGRGSGHGVGLCQAGAAAMAAQGRGAAKILAQYFPGAVAADEATGLAWQTLRGDGFTLETLSASDAGFLPDMSHALREAESQSGLRPDGGLTVHAFATTEAFRQGTLAPGWVAAFAEGDWIGAQPLRTLAARKLLEPVLRHEFLHALVEAQAGAGAPLWLREGLVEVWGNASAGHGARAELKLDEVDAALAHAASEAESERAHRAAAWYAQRLLDQYGRAQVVEWLRNGPPPTALAAAQ